METLARINWYVMYNSLPHDSVETRLETVIHQWYNKDYCVRRPFGKNCCILGVLVDKILVDLIPFYLPNLEHLLFKESLLCLSFIGVLNYLSYKRAVKTLLKSLADLNKDKPTVNQAESKTCFDSAFDRILLCELEKFVRALLEECVRSLTA